VIIPFYRKEVGMSTYEYSRRVLGVLPPLCIVRVSLAHFSKMGFVFT